MNTEKKQSECSRVVTRLQDRHIIYKDSY